MRSRLSLAGVALGGLLWTTHAAAAPPHTPDSRILAATVYADRADVRRVADGVAIGPGRNVVTFGNLPAGLDPGSVRASGSAAPTVRIVNVDVRRQNLETAERPEVRALQEELDGLHREQSTVEARRKGLQEGLAFLESVRLRTTLEAGELATSGGLDPDNLRRTLDFLTEEVAAKSRDLAESDRRREELGERERALQRELTLQRGGGHAAGWDAAVVLEADAAGAADVTLEYTVSGAGWAPEYDVVVSDDLRTIDLVVAASVRQNTGEDWDDVAITLSSAQPALGTTVPELSPWWLRVAPRLPAELPKSSPRLYPLDEAEVPPSAAEPAKPAEFTASPMRASGAFATTFDVPSRQDLASDGRTRRMHVGTVRLEGEVAHECVPGLSPHAFLVAAVRNASDLPLLAGASRVILGGQFVGRGRIEDVAPGQEFDLALGVDRAVEVERKLVARERDASGSRHESRARYRIEVTNHRTEPIRLTLRDRVPLSPDEDVDVRVRDVEPKPAADGDEDGILVWSLDVAPGARETAEFGYEVRYPAGRRPLNLASL
jgi:uncharacterized protein (TIGR02231 family)